MKQSKKREKRFWDCCQKHTAARATEVRKPRRSRGFHSRTASLFEGGLLPEDASSNASAATTVDTAALHGADVGGGGGAGAGAPADAAPPSQEASGATTVPRPGAPVVPERSLNGSVTGGMILCGSNFRQSTVYQACRLACHRRSGLSNS